MCRLAAYLGPARPLSDIMIAPAHSLIVQSQDAHEAKLAVNGDGFGVAWYANRPEPGLYKDILPAWSDTNLLSLCHQITSPLFMAHVRASTDAETARANCHPFSHENWCFMHNGQIGSFTTIRRQLEATLSDALYAVRRGNTDSELLFLLLLQAGLTRQPDTAVKSVIQLLHDTATAANARVFLRLTCVFSDGHRLYCFRYASDGRCPTLYKSHDPLSQATLIASEPLDGSAANWEEIAPNQLVWFGKPGDAGPFQQSALAMPLVPASAAQAA